jgi:hypothetical protein
MRVAGLTYDFPAEKESPGLPPPALVSRIAGYLTRSMHKLANP